MVNIAKDIKPISYVKAHTAEMLKSINETRKPIIITQNGEAKAVLLDADSYQGLLDSINLMKLISIGENDIRNGKLLDHDDVVVALKKILD